MPEPKDDCSYKDTPLPVETASARVRRNKDGQFAVDWDGHGAIIRVVRCFPWTDPGRHISLRDDENREILHITDLEDLDKESRENVERALDEAGFLLEVTRIDAIEEEFELRNWRVLTEQGPRTFQTKRDEWPRQVGRGGYLVRAVAGDLFHIPNPDTLDAASRKMILLYLD